MTALLKITRWVLFLPLAITLLFIAWFGVTWASTSFPWWGMLIIFLISATPLMVVSAWPVALAPNRKVGASIMATILIALEINQFLLTWNEWPTRILFWRILVDLKILRDLYAAFHIMDAVMKDTFDDGKDSTPDLIESTAQLCAEWDDLPTDEKEFTKILVKKFGKNPRTHAHEIFERAWEIFAEELEIEKREYRNRAIADGNSEFLEELDEIETKFSEQTFEIKLENASLEELYEMRDSSVKTLVEHLARPYGEAPWNLPLPEQQETFTKLFVEKNGEEYRSLAPAVLNRAWEISNEEYKKTGILKS